MTTAGTAQYICKTCKETFTARLADRARGWARYCSKSCKAVKQEQRTGQFSDLLRRSDHDDGLCFPGMDEDSVQGF